MKILITGVAGFIGYHVATKLLQQGKTIVGIDNLNNYYLPKLKEDRLTQLKAYSDFEFIKLDINDAGSMLELFSEHNFGRVVHLAAQAGVRYSLENPRVYIDANLVGFGNILECCRQHKIEHLVFASSSSVYGANVKQPFSEADAVDHPVSLYAATKKANELMAHSYASLFKLPCTGLRFFTVYGPWGRPDMALFKFVKNIINGEPIDVYNHGDMRRDFTYIDDIVAGILQVLAKSAAPDLAWQNNASPATSYAPYRVYNIGNGKPTMLLDFIAAIEAVLNKKANLNMLPMQPGDVAATFADTALLQKDFGYRPKTEVADGVKYFVDWYKEYFEV
ncbi:MAG: NAD-dependent epimerase [Gammaproteobacteria bacterium]|nr:NAD-dependent epimerase [Gammaproteobacteria bacterium]